MEGGSSACVRSTKSEGQTTAGALFQTRILYVILSKLDKIRGTEPLVA